MEERVVKSVKRKRIAIPSTFNISTADRNYFANGVLVHNCDDMHKVSDVESEAVRQTAVDWWATEMSNRGVDSNARFVYVGQRVHVADGAAWCKANGYEALIIPTEYEGKVQVSTCMPHTDPRTIEGELLWPSRYNREYIDSQKLALGSYGFAGQHQQRPAPRGGGMIKLEWFGRYSTPPAHYTRIIQSWDTAVTAKESSCPWAGVTIGEYRGNYYLLDLDSKKMEVPEGERRIKVMAARDRPNVLIIEDKASGSVILQRLKQDSEFHFSLYGEKPTVDKTTRMMAETPAIEAGRVFLPEEAPWLMEFEDILQSYPNSKTQDEIDAFSQALKYLREHPSISVSVPVGAPLIQLQSFERKTSGSRNVPHGDNDRSFR